MGGPSTKGQVATRCVISGKVQGVWYRAWTVQEAGKLGLRGWVRNRVDGSVEALFAGPTDKVAAMIDLCHIGPRAARVTNVAAEDFKGDIPDGFQQRDDA
jgi:acylphosphatase